MPWTEFYDTDRDAEWISSALLRIELTRAVARVMPVLLPDARDLLLAFSSIAIDDDIVEGAMGCDTRSHVVSVLVEEVRLMPEM